VAAFRQQRPTDVSCPSPMTDTLSDSDGCWADALPLGLYFFGVPARWCGEPFHRVSPWRAPGGQARKPADHASAIRALIVQDVRTQSPPKPRSARTEMEKKSDSSPRRQRTAATHSAGPDDPDGAGAYWRPRTPATERRASTSANSSALLVHHLLLDCDRGSPVAAVVGEFVAAQRRASWLCCRARWGLVPASIHC